MNFNQSQLEVINHNTGNCCIIAAAGSGKSSCIVNRVKHLVESFNTSAGKILCITFTKKSKDDLKNKLSKLLPLHYQEIQVETFHSLGYKIIKTQYGNRYSIADNGFTYDKIINDVVSKKLKLCIYKDVPTAKLRFFIGVQKNKLLLPNDNLDFSVWQDGFFSDKDLKEIYKLYEMEKEKLNLVDFDDLMIKTYFILKNNKNILKTYQDKYEFINVDEFQDTSKCQIQILKMISNKNNLLIVGDMLQNIYAWRGSDNSFMLKFREHFTNPKIINLNINYRSSDEIIEYSNQFASTLVESKSDMYRQSIGTNRSSYKINFKTYVDEFEESKDISQKIKELVTLSDITYKDIMIISRTNAQLQIMEMALCENEISSVGSRFTEKPEIKLILSYLKLINDVNDNNAFSYCFCRPLRWLDRKFLDEVKQCSKKYKIPSLFLSMFKIDRRNWKFESGIDELAEIVLTAKKSNCKNVRGLIKYLRERLDIDKFVSKSSISDDNNLAEEVENLNSLETIAEKFKTTHEFIEYISKLEDVKIDVDSVNLTTIHKAKGLESKICFVIGVSEGLLPHARNKNIDEEKRLYYVAITRAMDELFISSILKYNGKNYGVSNFLSIK